MKWKYCNSELFSISYVGGSGNTYVNLNLVILFLLNIQWNIIKWSCVYQMHYCHILSSPDLYNS